MSLPYVDEHSQRVAAEPERVWAALRRLVDRRLVGDHASPLTRLLGCDPPSGFGVDQVEEGRRIVLTGRHRFSRYRLELDVSDDPSGQTTVRATTYAAFPGLHGRAYRALVIGSRAHVVATRMVLRQVCADCT